MTFGRALPMWLAMTGLMMAPVVAPWIRALVRVAGTGGTAAYLPTVLAFGVGYAIAWGVFSALAAGLQTGLTALAVPVPFGLEARMHSGIALLLAGSFQFTRFKTACLRRCRSPQSYLLAHWRPGLVGSVRVGLGHGVDCVGCCWAVMALALVVGMAHLAWMGLLMAIMVAEMATPLGGRVTRPVGVALIVAGLVVIGASG